MSPQTLKRSWAALGATATTLILAACGGAPAVQRTSSANYTEAVTYARCIRAHGVGNFPDPTSNGAFVFRGAGSANPAHSPELNSASKACQHLLANGGQPSAAQQQQVAAVALKYARCMRAHEIPDFPDPTNGAGNSGFNEGGNESIDHNTPQYHAAEKACRSVLSGLPDEGP